MLKIDKQFLKDIYVLNTYLKNEKTLGFTLVEVLLVLGVVSLMTIGLFVFFNQERQETLINNHVKFLNIFNQNKQNFATATANFSIKKIRQ